MRAGKCLAFVVVAGGAIVGCAVPVASNLDEADANLIALSLEQSSIDATKEIDPTAEGRFRVSVGRDDAARAFHTLQDEALPRPRPKGILDATQSGGLIPSQENEHAVVTASLAGELERTLLGLGGVHQARVHLSVPAKEAFQQSKEKPTASVVLSFSGAPPVTEVSVQRIVAGAVTGLQKEDVSVVFVPVTRAAGTVNPSLSHVGPFAVSPGSRLPLQVTAAALIVFLAFAASTIIAFYMKLSKLRQELDAVKTK